ncbi:MAG: hypothetical protein AB1752_04065 [Candidatus Zixiibacteriota bacterium]
MTVFSLPLLIGGRKPPRTNEAIVLDLLVKAPLRWPEVYARLLIEKMPERIFKPLRHQSAETISSYVTHRRLPQRVGSGPVVCWISLGYGGGYMLLLERAKAGGHVPVWDSLLPVSVIAPELTFQDCNGDGHNDIIISGQLLEDGWKEWGIIGWDGDSAWVMAPRLDVPGKHRTYNRLIGRALSIVPPDSNGYSELRLHSPMPSMTEPQRDSLRVFVYADSLRGFIPVNHDTN